MPPDLSSTPLSWTDLSGTILPGGYELKELLEADGAAAQFRVRVLGDRDLDAVAQFIQVSPAEADRQIAIWDLMRDLRHPNLTIPLGAGGWERDGNELAYVVLRRADESLDGVLADRALTPSETKEVVVSVIAGLQALHGNELVHGCLSPEQVLAVADSILLPVTCVRYSGSEPEVPLVMPKYLAPESEDEDGEAGENVTPQSDVWCLGATIFESLTQKEWTEESREETAALPEPFAGIALRCLEEEPAKRCNLTEALALLKGEIKPSSRAKAAAAAAGNADLAAPPVPPLSPEPSRREGSGVQTQASQSVAAPSSLRSLEDQNLAPRPNPGSEPAVTSAPTRSQSVPQLPAPQKPAARLQSVPPPAPRVGVVRNPPAKPMQPTAVPRREPIPAEPGGSAVRERPVSKSVSKRWIWVGLAALFVLGLVWLLRPKSDTRAPVVVAKASNPATKPILPPPPSGETKVLQPDGTATPKIVTPPEKPAVKPTVRSTKRTAVLAPPSAAATSSQHGDIWHVILYTYARQEDADRMAQSINKRRPGIQAQVFSSKENDGPYLVTAGAGMSREEAVQARRKAVGNGMPRDSYIQNYNR